MNMETIAWIWSISLKGLCVGDLVTRWWPYLGIFWKP
jgi:hypothetical protein